MNALAWTRTRIRFKCIVIAAIICGGANYSSCRRAGKQTRPTHKVFLTWNRSTSTDVIGYGVYRADVSGGPYTRLATQMGSSPAFTDTTVKPAHIYYYVVTAIDRKGNESKFSNQAQAAVLGP